jgi:hypothetical protein
MRVPVLRFSQSAAAVDVMIVFDSIDVIQFPFKNNHLFL